MSNQLIDFESGSTTTGDSGERTTSTAIKPILSGEGVKSAVLDRPLENLRARTEEIRKSVEDLLYRADADKWIITGGSGTGAVTVPGAAAFPTVTWNATAGATGTFTISEPIVIQPLMAPYRDIKGIGEGAHTYTITDSVPNTVTFTFYSRLFDYQLANQLRIIWEEKDSSLITGGYCVATLEGSPAHVLRIVIRDDGMTQGTNINTALGLILPATAVSHSMGGTGSTYGSTYVALSDITDPDFVIKGNYSRELHRLTDTELVTFFGTTANHMHTDGEGLGIWFEEIIDSDPLTFGGRRQSTPDTAPAPNTAVTASKLFLTTTESSKIHGAIPLCRRIGTYLVFVDGTVVGNGQTVKFGQKGTEIVDIFALLADQAGADAGNTLIGCDAVTDTPLSLVAGTQRAQTVELLGDVNDLALEIDDLREDRVYSYNLDAADPQKMISTGLWNESWGIADDVENVVVRNSLSQQIDLSVYFDPASGVAKLLILDVRNTRIDTVDTRTLVIENVSPDLTANLPSGSSETWVPKSMCTDGVSVYVLFTDTHASPDAHQVQSWDIATWAVKAGWPTTGTALSTGNPNYERGGSIIVASSTRLAVCNSWTTVTASSSPVISILDIVLGGLVASGAGDCSTVVSARSTTAICSDGTYVYFGTFKSGPYVGYICSALIAVPTGGVGGTAGYPLSCTGSIPKNLVSCGSNQFVSLHTPTASSTATDVILRVHRSTAADLDQILRGQDSSGTPNIGYTWIYANAVYDSVFDGLNIWIYTHIDNQSSGAQGALIKLDVAKLSGAATNVYRQIGDLTNSVFLVPTTGAMSGASTLLASIVFDGRDIWVSAESVASRPYSGKTYRLPLALLRH